MNKIERLLEKLAPYGLTEKGRDKWKSRCPAHDDKKPSLDIEVKSGKPLLVCRTGCDNDDILRALGLEWKDIDPTLKGKPKPRRRQQGALEASYHYQGRDGTYLFTARKYRDRDGGKRFVQGRQINGTWRNGLGGITPTLYQLPALIQAVAAGETIYLPEGEKDVDELREHGLAATCNPMGAGKWRSEYSEHLRGADVVLLQDNDDAGRAHTDKVANALQGIAASVKVVEFTDLPRKGDVYDWLTTAGHTVDELRERAATAPAWEPPPDPNATRPIEEIEAAIEAIPLDDLRAQRCALKAIISDVAKLDALDQSYVLNLAKSRGISSKGTLQRAIAEAEKAAKDREKNPEQSELAEIAETVGGWRHDPNTGHWYQYDDGVWRQKSQAAAKAMLMGLASEHCPKGYTDTYINGTSGLFRTRVQHEVWNDKDNLIPCQNGALDLDTCDLTDYQPGHNFTWQVPYQYDPGADCPTIKSWVFEAMEGDEGRVHALRAWLAAIVRGRVDLQKFVELVGRGGSGKGTFIRLAMDLVGKESTFVTTIKELEESRFGRAGIIGKRLMVVTDAEQWHKGVDVLKSITGQDAISVEQKHEKVSGLGYTPKCLVLMAGNQPLQSNDHTTGLLRRRITIPFNLGVPEGQRRDLNAEFEPELPGLLNWVLELSNDEINTALEVDGNGSLKVSRAETLLQTNPLGAWFKDCVSLEPGHRVAVGRAPKVWDGDLQRNVYQDEATKLYPNYKAYSESTGRRPCAHNQFSKHLALIFEALAIQGGYFERGSRSDFRAAHFEGIRLCDDDDGTSGTHPVLDPVLSNGIAVTYGTFNDSTTSIEKNKYKSPEKRILSFSSIEKVDQHREVPEVTVIQGKSTGKVPDQVPEVPDQVPERKPHNPNEPYSQSSPDMLPEKGVL